MTAPVVAGLPYRYASADGTSVYHFEVRRVNGSAVSSHFEPVLRLQPQYGARSREEGATRRRRAVDGAMVLAGPAGYASTDKAAEALGHWAELNEVYRRTGVWPTSPGGAQRRGVSRDETIYMASDRVGIYIFRFVQHGQIWRAHISSQPCYAGRSEGAHESHRLGLGSGTPYVCWAPEPTTLTGAKEVARLWAEGTQRYIATGRFPSPADIPAAPRPRSALDASLAWQLAAATAQSGRLARWQQRVLRRIG